MAVRAKFMVHSITHSLSGQEEGQTIILYPVRGNSPENKEFYRWTPGGKIELMTVNPAAGNQFALGQEFYIDFTPANPA